MAKETKERKELWEGIFRPGNKKVGGEVRPERAHGVKTLWGHEFNLVQEGLEETQVVAYVEGLNSRHSGAVEKLQQPQSLSAVASKVIFEAEKLAEGVELEARKRAAEQAAEMLLRAEVRSEEIIDETEVQSALLLQEATMLSVAIIEEVRRRTALAEEVALQQVPQQVASIQAALQAAIDQAYQKVIADLMGLEDEVQSRGAKKWLQPVGASQSKAAPVESHREANEREPEVSAGSIPAPWSEEHQIAVKEEEALPGLPGPALHELSNSHDGVEEEEDYANLSRDEVREKILESFQQVIGSNGHGEALTPKEEAKMDGEQVSPDPEPESVATNGNGDVSKASSDMYAGDMEFIMSPQRDGSEAKNHLAQLSALYMTVKKIPGASVLGTGGSEVGGNSIAVHFESPVCLDEVLKDVKMWEEERPGNGATGSRSLLGRLKSGKGVSDLQRKRILVTL